MLRLKPQFLALPSWIEKSEFVNTVRQGLQKTRRFLRLCKKKKLFRVVTSAWEIDLKIKRALNNHAAIAAKMKATELPTKERKEKEYTCGLRLAEGTETKRKDGDFQDELNSSCYQGCPPTKRMTPPPPLKNDDDSRCYQGCPPANGVAQPQLTQLLQQQEQGLSEEEKQNHTNSVERIPRANNSHTSVPPKAATIASVLSDLERHDGIWRFFPLQQLPPEILNIEVDGRWTIKLTPLPPFNGVNEEPICLSLSSIQ